MPVSPRKSVHFEADSKRAGGPTHSEEDEEAFFANNNRSDMSVNSNTMNDHGQPYNSNHDIHNNNNFTNNGPVPLFQLTREDVQSAFEFFDVAHTGYITQPVLKSRLAAFYPNLTSKEYKFLLEQTATPTATGNMIPPIDNAAAPAAAAAAAASGSSINNNNSSNAGIANRGAVVGGSMTAVQLWELIDTFQRLFMVPAMERVTAAAAASTSSDSRNNNNSTSMNASINNNNNNNSSSSITPSMMTDALRTFDPVRETFDQVFDPAHTGAVPVETLLKPLMARLGYGDLQDSDLQLLVRTADFDGDGKITLTDFRRLVAMKGRFRNSSTANSGGGAHGGHHGTSTAATNHTNAAAAAATTSKGKKGGGGAAAGAHTRDGSGGSPQNEARRVEPAGGGAAAAKRMKKNTNSSAVSKKA